MPRDTATGPSAGEPHRFDACSRARGAPLPTFPQDVEARRRAIRPVHSRADRPTSVRPLNRAAHAPIARASGLLVHSGCEVMLGGAAASDVGSYAGLWRAPRSSIPEAVAAAL